ncbi:MAG: hypothetical protein ACI9LM_005381 [Alteromonadaceae bacterium]|jgi:hypothetical protein
MNKNEVLIPSGAIHGTSYGEEKWQHFLLSLLKTGSVRFLKEPGDALLSESYEEDLPKDLTTPIEEFFKQAKNFISNSDLTLPVIDNKYQRNYLIQKVGCGALSALELKGFVSKSPNVHELYTANAINKSFDIYVLTAKGVDIAVKLQEHKDNNEQHGVQSRISRTMKTNSTISAISSFVAVIVSCVALALTYNIFDVNNERLNIAKDEKEKLIRQSAILKKAINDIATLKSDRVRLANLEKQKNQKNTIKKVEAKMDKATIKKVEAKMDKATIKSS